MSLTTTVYPRQTRLTTLRRVKVELGLDLSAQTHDELLTDLIDEASEAVESFCAREFTRATVTETMAGAGRTRLLLSRVPVAAVSSVVYADSTITSSDYSIEDADQGFLYREDGWYYTVTEDSADLVPKVIASLPILDYSVTYTGGYLVPDDNIVSKTISIATSTACLKDSASSLPLVAAGDRITLSAGWTAGSNLNTVATVVSRTASKIVVDSTTLTAEASTDQPRSVTVRQAPGGLPRDVERACVETVKAWYYRRTTDPTVTGKQVGDLRIDRSVTALEQTLPSAVQRLLAPYRRRV